MIRHRSENLRLSNKLKTAAALALILAGHYLTGQTYVGQVSKRATTAAAILEIPVSARALAMGNAYSASVSDGSAFYWNPAAPARQTGTTLYAMYMPWLVDTYYSHFAVITPAPRQMVVGASVTTWGMDDMIVRTEEYQQGTGEKFDAGDLVVAVSISRALTNKYAIGFTAKYIQERIWHSTASTIALDLGTLFRADLGHGLNIAAVISNYGGDMRLDGRDVGTFTDPDPTIEGNNARIPSQYEMEGWPLPLCFRFGLATDVVRINSLRITAEMDALHPSNNFPSIDTGIEMAFRELAFLRAGYSGIGIDDSVEGISIGAGIKLSVVRGSSLALDYAFKDFGPFGYLQAIALDVGF
ncbi:MAG: PorV/PorQ family protein [Fidelibacterota bacterium]|nr:MAG: PorV/PorQ family protein [Candidatus Neomarinimicrobiota bacterium]